VLVELTAWGVVSLTGTATHEAGLASVLRGSRGQARGLRVALTDLNDSIEAMTKETTNAR